MQVPMDAAKLKVDSETGTCFVFETNFQVCIIAAPFERGAGLTPFCLHQVSLPVGKVVASKNKAEGGDSECDEEDDGDNAGNDDQDDEDEMQNPLLLVSKDVVCWTRGEYMLKTADFWMVGNNIQLSKGYRIQFVHPVLMTRCVF